MPARNHHSPRATKAVRLGDPQLDRYLEFVESRARHNTLLATASDLKAFFAVVDKPTTEVTAADVLGFIAEQRKPRGDGKVVRLVDGEAGLTARTIKRRLSSVSGLYSYLVLCGDVMANPVPRGLATRHGGGRGPGLIRSPRTLPKILSPAEVNGLVGALRTHRDRAMVEAMVLGGLRRCEVLGLRMEDLRPGEHQVFIADGKGGHQRLVPMSPRFFRSVGLYLEHERPREASTAYVFVALKGAVRGQPLADDGLDKVVMNAKNRAGLVHCTCHELRHTCLTRLREAGMALEAIQAQAGHRSLDSTRVYLHLANDWLAAEYVRAAAIIDGHIADEFQAVAK
ncbi:MAG TPA: tyrosine-type recombinase/integrase [Acidimicrobiales bacterium]|nr:tyrosine-type recombinase/integrase [Acidimicrobiales bacterium]